MIVLLLVAAIALAPASVAGWRLAKGEEVDRGIASLYRPWRKGPTVPYARYPGNWKVKPTRKDIVCAHRTIPFGTRLRLSWKRGSAVCVVLDRGPYGFCEWTGWGRPSAHCPWGYKYTVTARGKRARGYYRGVIDATPAVHRMMRSSGWVRVRVERLPSLGRSSSVLRVRQGSGV